MKTGSSKMKNMIASHGIDGSHAAEMLKEAWRAFRSLLKASPNLIKNMDAEKLKDIHVMDHLVRRKKRSNNEDGINILMQHSTSTVLAFDHLSHPVNEAAAAHDHSLSLTSTEEVDELADAFISRFYSNMRLEKQRSYRSYQEMLARGT